MNNYYNNNQNSPSFGMWLTLSILCAIFASRICGIIAIIFIVVANSAYKNGNLAEYQYNLKIVKIVLTIGLVVGIVFFVLGSVFGFLFGVLRFFTHHIFW